ncbi:transcriptional regulator [Cereibacter changlensis JA139]|uniref:Transcriptional regulator n=3 Tax=Cereibacter changlensis TaxID=402884 RepID=A0A2T4JT15_9RHOB|nr:Crp/Fnr family transcriptional regulator [Cereibacter changlensis]PTE21045.1 transcriptional regulator [Cereibacter changlensis JA139]PZX48259.1 CRP/FNR family transcriptional regulator [Cereibacter changlensis]
MPKDLPICQTTECLICFASAQSRVLPHARTAFHRSYAAGRVIVAAREKMGFVGSISRGIAKMTLTLMDGRQQIIGLATPTSVLGWPGRPTAPVTITAVSDVTVCAMHRGAFEDLMLRYPVINQKLLALRLAELDAARDWLTVLGAGTARERVARLLVVIALQRLPPDVPSDRPASFQIPFLRAEMADCLGMATETVTRCLTSLQAEGIISLNRLTMVEASSLDGLINAAGGTYVDPTI